MEFGQILALPIVQGIACFLGSFVILGIIGLMVPVFEQIKKELLNMEASKASQIIAFGILGLIGLFLLIISISLFVKGMGLCFSANVEIAIPPISGRMMVFIIYIGLFLAAMVLVIIMMSKLPF